MRQAQRFRPFVDDERARVALEAVRTADTPFIAKKLGSKKGKRFGALITEFWCQPRRVDISEGIEAQADKLPEGCLTQIQHPEDSQEKPVAKPTVPMEKEKADDSRWTAIRVEVMKKGLQMKVQQHKGIRLLLLASGERQIVELGSGWRKKRPPPADNSSPFWEYATYRGQRIGFNMMGKLWMEVRAELMKGNAVASIC